MLKIGLLLIILSVTIGFSGMVYTTERMFNCFSAKKSEKYSSMYYKFVLFTLIGFIAGITVVVLSLEGVI